MLSISTSWLTAGPQKQANENSLWSDGQTLTLCESIGYIAIFSYISIKALFEIASNRIHKRGFKSP